MNKNQINLAFPDNRWREAREAFKQYYGQNQIALHGACDAYKNLIALLLSTEFDPVPKVSGRVKEQLECIKKFERKYLSKQEEQQGPIEIAPKITDLVGLRVVCIYESDIERVADILRSNLDVIDETDKTEALEIHENQFGYKGLHLDAKLNEDRASLPEYAAFSGYHFEVQIRSIVQDAWSEVDHRLKYKKRIPKPLKRRINRLAALFELADQEFEAIRDNTTDLEMAAEESTDDTVANEPLTPFNFVRAIKDFFGTEDFEPYKVDGFVDELLRQNEDMSVADLNNALSKNMERVRNYKKYLSEPPMDHDMNPFTQIRHCLYLEKKVLYENLMRAGPQKNFDRWLEHGTVHPREIEMKTKYSQ